jgi:hypothetical protein
VGSEEDGIDAKRVSNWALQPWPYFYSRFAHRCIYSTISTCIDVVLDSENETGKGHISPALYIRKPAQNFFALARACPSLLDLEQAKKHQKFQKLKSNLELPEKFLSPIFLKSKKGAK